MTGVTRKAGAGLLAAGLIWQSGAIAQEHHLHHIEPVKPVFPRLGKGRELTGTETVSELIGSVRSSLHIHQASGRAFLPGRDRIAQQSHVRAPHGK